MLIRLVVSVYWFCKANRNHKQNVLFVNAMGKLSYKTSYRKQINVVK